MSEHRRVVTAARDHERVHATARRAGGVRAVLRDAGEIRIALHDARDGSLYLVRDHFGIKPFYYAEIPGGLVFASSARMRSPQPGQTVNGLFAASAVPSGLTPSRREPLRSGS